MMCISEGDIHNGYFPLEYLYGVLIGCQWQLFIITVSLIVGFDICWFLEWFC